MRNLQSSTENALGYGNYSRGQSQAGAAGVGVGAAAGTINNNEYTTLVTSDPTYHPYSSRTRLQSRSDPPPYFGSTTRTHTHELYYGGRSIMEAAAPEAPQHPHHGTAGVNGATGTTTASTTTGARVATAHSLHSHSHGRTGHPGHSWMVR